MQLLQSTYRQSDNSDFNGFQSDNNDAIVRISIPKSSREVSHKNKYFLTIKMFKWNCYAMAYHLCGFQRSCYYLGNKKRLSYDLHDL